MVLQRSYVTRGLHVALLLIVLHQLVVSLFMERPFPGEDADWPLLAHQWLGLAGFGVTFLFWIWTLVRDPRETSLGALLPWFSPSHIGTVVAEVIEVLRAILARRAPEGRLEALASAVHGLGLLTATYLAFSGAAWMFVFQGTAMARLVMETHSAAGNLMWAYVIGHAGMGALHHLRGDAVFSRMFFSMPRRLRAERRRRLAPAR